MVYATGLIEVMPRIDSIADCEHCGGVDCGGSIVWDEVHGWMHTDRWYACRWPHSSVPREVMAAPAPEARS
jgi:hypothetical protein